MTNQGHGCVHPWAGLKRAWPSITPYQHRKWKHLWRLFPRMVDVLPPQKAGKVEIYHTEISPWDAWLNRHNRNELWTPGRFVQLNIDGVGWMYDILHERIMNEIAVIEARGDVLIAGLGIGMILHPILAKPSVTSVRVLENNLHIIDLVAPSLETIPGAQKLVIELADASEWEARGKTFDAIWLDCVPFYGYGHAILDLHQGWLNRFAPFLRPGGWHGHWGFLENLQWILDEGYRKAGRKVRKRAFPMGKALGGGVFLDKGDLEAQYGAQASDPQARIIEEKAA